MFFFFFEITEFVFFDLWCFFSVPTIESEVCLDSNWGQSSYRTYTPNTPLMHFNFLVEWHVIVSGSMTWMLCLQKKKLNQVLRGEGAFKQSVSVRLFRIFSYRFLFNSWHLPSVYYAEMHMQVHRSPHEQQTEEPTIPPLTSSPLCE